jgi:diacylglycerol O-acyltransferase / wax synthase
MERLSALDASFLAVETDTTPMHVGWVATFDEPWPGFDALSEHIADRLSLAPRFRQRLAEVPLGVHDPVWADDPHFDPAEHLHGATGDVGTIADTVFSTPLRRDRPLWEITIVEGDQPALVGKMHHCMVDGTAAVQLTNLLLDAEPDAANGERAEWTPVPEPSAPERFARGMLDRTGDVAALALAPARLATAPHRLPGALARGVRTGARTLLPPASGSPFNQPGTAHRHHVRVTRSLDEIRAVRRRFRTTPNDVLLAAVAGALRGYFIERGDDPQRLKTMVPADVRASDDADTGNRISFLFLELPCDEPDAVARLQRVHEATATRADDGTAEALDFAFRALARTPGPLQHALAQAFAHPRLFNLTVSAVPGPAVPRYLRGCRLREVHSSVPLAARHALSIGFVTVAGNACMGITADPAIVPDADAIAPHFDAALDELLAACD